MTGRPEAPPAGWRPCIVGRSSSHFTRVVRMCAHECGVDYDFRPVLDLLSAEARDFGGNPGLRLPNLVTPDGVVFGSLNSCRTIAALARQPVRIVWPEHVTTQIAANAQELTLQAMATEVTWILTHSSEGTAAAYAVKLRVALLGMLGWLEQNLDSALAELPGRQFSYLELALFCLLEHLEFRGVCSLGDHVRLNEFRHEWQRRHSAVSTVFAFDVPS